MLLINSNLFFFIGDTSFRKFVDALPFSLHGFPAPFQRRCSARPYRVIAVYSVQTVMCFSRFNGGVKKSVAYFGENF